MAGITFRSLMSRIEELERQRMGKRYTNEYWDLPPEQRENPVALWWVVRKPGVAKWEFGWMVIDILRDTTMWSGHRRCGHHSYHSSLSREPECIPNYDSCALRAFKESEHFWEWFYEMLAWEDHDRRYWGLIAQGERIRSWFTPYITPTMCPDWSEPRGYIAKRLKGEPEPVEVPATMPLPSVEAVHQKRLEHWEKCQRYGSEPELSETQEWYERRYGDNGLDDGA